MIKWICLSRWELYVTWNIVMQFDWNLETKSLLFYYFMHFKLTPVFFYLIFFISFKAINRLISKWISNIYLKVTNEKKWRSQNFHFLNLKDFSPGQLLRGLNSQRHHWILKLLVALKIRGLGARLCVTFLLFFILKGIMAF